MNNDSSRTTGIGFCGLLTILFIGLKLTNYIDWPWIWVLAPTWISLLLGLIIVAIYALFVFRHEVKHFIKKTINKKEIKK